MEQCLFFLSVSVVQIFNVKYFHRLKIAHMSYDSVFVVASLLFTIICTQSTSQKLIITNCWRCRCRHPRRRRRRRHYYCFGNFGVCTLCRMLFYYCARALHFKRIKCVFPFIRENRTRQRRNIPSISTIYRWWNNRKKRTLTNRNRKQKRRMFVFSISSTLFHTIRNTRFYIFSVSKRENRPLA